jgi:hypothetical protein
MHSQVRLLAHSVGTGSHAKGAHGHEPSGDGKPQHPALKYTGHCGLMYVASDGPPSDASDAPPSDTSELPLDVEHPQTIAITAAIWTVLASTSQG